MGSLIPTVCIVDDDVSVRTALSRLFRAAGLRSVELASWEAFLALETADEPNCVVADISTLAASSLKDPSLPTKRGRKIPVIFLGAEDSAHTRAQAKHAGAFGFFRKPVDDQALLDAIAWAMEENKEASSQLRPRRPAQR